MRLTYLDMANILLSSAQRNTIHEQCNKILENYENVSSTIELLTKLAKANNITLLEKPLFDLSGVLDKRGNSWEVIVNSEDSQTRKVFSIAHEFGHYFLHRDQAENFVDGDLIKPFNRDESDKFAKWEVEANEFAGCLLMPESKIKKVLKKGEVTQDKVIELAQQFQVSSLAMFTRLKNLEYVV